MSKHLWNREEAAAAGRKAQQLRKAKKFREHANPKGIGVDVEGLDAPLHMKYLSSDLVSLCCLDFAYVLHGHEGTNCYVCSNCHRATDVKRIDEGFDSYPEHTEKLQWAELILNSIIFGILLGLVILILTGRHL